MRILQVGKFYPPEHGGMERVVGEICEGLASRGHDVLAAVAASSVVPGRSVLNRVNVVRLETKGTLLSQPLLKGLKEEIRNFRPDVIHFHLPNPLALAQGWCDDLPTCVTLHAETTGIRRMIDRAWTNHFLKRAQGIVYSSEQMRTRWPAPQSSRAISRVIPFGFRFGYLEPAGALQDPALILFVGRLVPYKGVETLLRAMTKVKGKLAIAGTGRARLNLENLVLDLGLKDNVRFLGAIDDAELADWYERCAIYVQPSISQCEAFGISMLEAMHLGRPVISTDLPTGVQEVNRHLQTGLVVPPRNPRALAAALNTLLSDQDLAKSLGAGAREHEKKFSAHAMIEAHLDLYRSLVGETRNEVIFQENPSLQV